MTSLSLKRDTSWHNITKIHFKTSQCFGECPVFELVIDSDRTATYNAIMYNEQHGKSQATIEEGKYKYLLSLLNYIDFQNLKDKYRVAVTDLSGAELTMEYDNGKVKKIDDYPKQGTRGLQRVYNILYDLRSTQNWVQ